MPTGYTADIAKGITFKEYAWNCARAFGALIEMRDAPRGAPIPELFEPSDYHAKELSAAELRRRELIQLDHRERNRRAEAHNEEQRESYARRIAEYDALEAKYRDMLGQVEAYTSPSPDHDEFKTFMRDQIAKSIEFDCCKDYMTKPVELSPGEWLAQAIAKTDRDIDYHSREHAKELERTEGRNRWLAQLRASLA